jgi:uncharacterized protein involved in exopolysaccharide biosynthesis
VTFSIVIRLLETFFRRWYFYLVPLVALVGLGLSNVASTPTEFKSTGVIKTSNASLLSELTDVGTGTPFSFETASSLTSSKIASLMGTDAFARTVAAGAGVTEALETGAITLGAIRGAIVTFPVGDDLLAVSATTTVPELSRRLVESTIKSYRDEVIDVELTQAQTAEEVLEGRLDRRKAELDDARSALAEYVRDNPEPPLGADRPFDEQVAMDELASTVARADVQYVETLNQYEAAALVTEQTRAEVEGRIAVIDPPQTPLFAEPQRRAMVLKMGLFTILGSLLTITLVAVATALDHTVRREVDIEAQVGLAVAATVPNAR